jgi:DNA-binding XRE family transcriptional regulator
MPKVVRTQPEPTALEFGQMLMRRRLKLKLTKHALGQKVGVSGDSIGCWEDGMTVPMLTHAVRWCEALGLDLWPCEPGQFGR